MNKLTITHAALNPDFDFEGGETGTNEVLLTLSDGTEIFVGLKGADLRWPELSLTTAHGRTVCGVDVALFRVTPR